MFRGLSVVVGYALFGACRLVWRSEGKLQAHARCHAQAVPAVTRGLIVVVSLWTPMLQPHCRRRWNVRPRILHAAPVPVLVAALAVPFWRNVADARTHLTPLLWAPS